MKVFPRRLVEAGALMTTAEVDRIEELAAVARRGLRPLVEETSDGLRIPEERSYPRTTSGRGVLGPGCRTWRRRSRGRPRPATPRRSRTGPRSRGSSRGCLERDPEAFVLGEEVGHLGGGVCGLTKGALAAAPDRVLSTPICENGFAGAAFGAALRGCTRSWS